MPRPAFTSALLRGHAHPPSSWPSRSFQTASGFSSQSLCHLLFQRVRHPHTARQPSSTTGLNHIFAIKLPSPCSQPTLPPRSRPATESHVALARKPSQRTLATLAAPSQPPPHTCIFFPAFCPTVGDFLRHRTNHTQSSSSYTEDWRLQILRHRHSMTLHLPVVTIWQLLIYPPLNVTKDMFFGYNTRFFHMASPDSPFFAMASSVRIFSREYFENA